MVLQKDAENNMEGEGKQRESSKENGNKMDTFVLNQTEVVDISGTRIEERGHGIFDAQGYICG